MLNKIILIGRLTRDPELRYTGQGTAVANFGLAVDRQRSRDGERQTDFIDIVCWRATAEFAANYLQKGRLISVDGKLQIRDWVAQDGTKRRSAEVVADNIQALDKPKTQGGGESYHAGGEPSADTGDTTEEVPDPEAYDDPFMDE